MPSTLIPAVDPAGLPAPAALLEGLLLLTFFLHLLFVNLALGGTLLAWLARWRAGGDPAAPLTVLSRRLTAVNGFAVSLAITTGVAPLLFIQTLYQPLFYSGTILIGGAWFGLLGLLIAGYYALYLVKLGRSPALGTWWLGTAAACFAAIAAIHVAVHLVHVQPAGWTAVVRRPWSVLADPSFAPRWLHFVLAGLGFSALLMTAWSVRRARKGQDRVLEGAIARIGWRWLLWTTGLQIVDGFLLLAVLPRGVLLGLMRGGAATMVPLTIAVAGGAALLLVAARWSDPVEVPAAAWGALAGFVALIGVMVVTRHQLRELYIGGAVEPAAMASDPQWLNIGLFAVLLLAALGVTGWMVRAVLTSPATGSDAA